MSSDEHARLTGKTTDPHTRTAWENADYDQMIGA